MKNEITVDGVVYIKKGIDPMVPNTKKFKDVFECKDINDLFEFAGEDIGVFKAKHSALTPKKLAQELIEKGISIINGTWLPTLDNTWYYPYFERTPSGFVYCDWRSVGDYGSVGTALVLENGEKATLAGTIMLPQYNIYINP